MQARHWKTKGRPSCCDSTVPATNAPSHKGNVFFVRVWLPFCVANCRSASTGSKCGGEFSDGFQRKTQRYGWPYSSSIEWKERVQPAVLPFSDNVTCSTCFHGDQAKCFFTCCKDTYCDSAAHHVGMYQHIYFVSLHTTEPVSHFTPCRHNLRWLYFHEKIMSKKGHSDSIWWGKYACLTLNN